MYILHLQIHSKASKSFLNSLDNISCHCEYHQSGNKKDILIRLRKFWFFLLYPIRFEYLPDRSNFLVYVDLLLNFIKKFCLPLQFTLFFRHL